MKIFRLPAARCSDRSHQTEEIATNRRKQNQIITFCWFINVCEQIFVVYIYFVTLTIGFGGFLLLKISFWNIYSFRWLSPLKNLREDKSVARDMAVSTKTFPINWVANFSRRKTDLNSCWNKSKYDVAKNFKCERWSPFLWMKMLFRIFFEDYFAFLQASSMNSQRLRVFRMLRENLCTSPFEFSDEKS